MKRNIIAETIVAFAAFTSLGEVTHAASLKNRTLSAATSPYEDLAEAALAKDVKGVAEALTAAEAHVVAVRNALSPAAVVDQERLLEAIRRAAKARDHQATALNAVEMFRLLIDGREESEQTKHGVPKEVSLLDYAGFRLHALAAAPEPNWREMQTTAADAAKWWGAIKGKVKGKGLRDSFDSTVRGIQQASAAKNLPMLHFAAQIDLDLVDLLEAQFTE